MEVKKRILIVDDETDAVDYLARMLEKQGYEPVSAYNGQDGFDIIQNNKIDAVVADISMSEMGGYELCQKLKESQEYSDIPLIICTAYPNKERIFRQLGIDDYLVKPFEFDVLFESLNRIFSQVSHFIKYKKILVQSNNISEIQAVADQMKKFGFRIEITTVSEGDNLTEEALTGQPDIAIINAVQGSIISDQLIKSLKGYVDLKNIEVIIYIDETEEIKNKEGKKLSREQIKERCFEAGADEYIVSLDRENFFNLLLEHCKIHKQG